MEVIKIFPPSKMGIVNVRYKMDDMTFDAAIDFDHEMHAYELTCFEVCDVPIELYNCSRDWDIQMVYPKLSRQQMHECVAAGITGTALADILESETRKWIDAEPDDIYCPSDIDYIPTPVDDFVEYLERYGNDAFITAIVEMLKSGELRVTWEQAQALWERGGKTHE